MTAKKIYPLALIPFILFLLILFIGIPLGLYYISSGNIDEGIPAYIKKVIASIIIPILCIAFLYSSFISIKKRINYLFWLIGAVLAILISYFFIRNVVADIPYLSNHEIMTLENLHFDVETEYEFSTFYKLEGESNKKEYTFTINKDTHDQGEILKEQNDNLRAYIEYLPNTHTVMKIKYQ